MILKKTAWPLNKLTAGLSWLCVSILRRLTLTQISGWAVNRSVTPWSLQRLHYPVSTAIIKATFWKFHTLLVFTRAEGDDGIWVLHVCTTQPLFSAMTVNGVSSSRIYNKLIIKPTQKWSIWNVHYDPNLLKSNDSFMWGKDQNVNLLSCFIIAFHC